VSSQQKLAENLVSAASFGKMGLFTGENQLRDLWQVLPWIMTEDCRI